MTQKHFNIGSWLVWVSLLALALTAWGRGVNWQIGSLTVYQWFPLLGMVAWLTMALHYFAGALRLLRPELERPPYFKPVTGYVVLASLLLHPGLLALAQLQNGQGLPPESFRSYVAPGLEAAVFFGLFSLVIFMSYEVFDRIREQPSVRRHWWAVSISQSLAMVLIWVHALRLGSHLGQGWFRALWVVLGLLLLPCFYLITKADLTPAGTEET